MELILDNISKRYLNDWIFRKVNYQFKSGHSYAVGGPNGSGKSTFLRILSAHLTPTKGTIKFTHKNQTIAGESVFQHLSFAAPYIELLEEFSLREMIGFHQKFKPLQNDLTTDNLLKVMQLESSSEKEIRFFSSGMKQRVRLGLALCSESDLVLLDEPTTNLDQRGMNWYKKMVKEFAKNKTLIIASNVEEDFDFCDSKINILDWKN